MARQRIVVTGHKQIDKELAALGPKLAAKLHRTASRKAAKMVMQAARTIVPKDKGRYGQSMTVRSLPRSRRRMGHVVTQRDYSARSGKTGKPAWYGKFLELGWTAGGKKRGAYKMNAPLENLIAYAKRAEKRPSRPLRPRKKRAGWFMWITGKSKTQAAVRLYIDELKRALF